MKVPDTCLLQNNINEKQKEDDPPINSVDKSGSCTHAGIYYSDGSQWTSSEEVFDFPNLYIYYIENILFICIFFSRAPCVLVIMALSDVIR